MEDKRLFSVDRIEGDLAVVMDDDGVGTPVPRADLPVDTREGTMLRLTEHGYVPDPEAEEARRHRVLELQRRLRGK